MANTENHVGTLIVESAIEVHRTLGGPGLLESVYEEALVWEMKHKGLEVRRQVIVPIVYKGNLLANPLRLDLMINNLVIIECKATTVYHDVFEAQVLTYLRLTGKKLGYVLNFGDKIMRTGVHRVVNGL